MQHRCSFIPLLSLVFLEYANTIIHSFVACSEYRYHAYELGHKLCNLSGC